MIDLLATTGHLSQATPAIVGLLVSAAGLNGLVGVARWRASRSMGRMASGLALAVVFAAMAIAALLGHPLGLPHVLKQACDSLLTPLTLTAGWLAAGVLVWRYRRFVASPLFCWIAWNVSWLWLALSLEDRAFATTVLDPDRAPIVAMLYLLAVCLVVALRQGLTNDERMARGEPPEEAEESTERYHTWPDLVSIELVAIVAATCLLLLWSILVPAPLDAPANAMVTPNPSMAPWYFVGLQELLVYFDPTVAGVIVPLLILFGLVAIPYLDVEHKTTGYYTLERRPVAIPLFLFGFLQLWVLLIVIGVFFRGPNWGFFGLYADRGSPAAPVVAMITLAEMFWIRLLGWQTASVSPGTGHVGPLQPLLREMPGFVVLGSYFLLVPWWLGRARLARWRSRLGTARYRLFMFLALAMGLIPIKMMLNWALHINYLISIPEWTLRI